MKTLILILCVFLGAQTSQARPTQHHEVAPTPTVVDVVGPLDGAPRAPSKATIDTTWIATWDFEGCDDTGWEVFDNKIRNDGNVYWSVNGAFSGMANITGEAAVCGHHDLCWVFPDGYDNDWNQGIRIHYVGDSFLSFDYLIDSEQGFDFLQVETDEGCSSFSLVDYDVNPVGTAAGFRNLVWAVSGFDTVTARVDSVALSGYASTDTHCVYIAFYSDGAWSPADGDQGTTLGVGVVVDNVLLEGDLPVSEDFAGFSPSLGFSFLNMQDSTPFGTWARLYSHITDNDLCTENPTCAWLSTDDTTPLVATEPSMAFGPDSYVMKWWLDEIVVGPWVSLSNTSTAVSTVLQFRRFGGNFFSASRIVQGWSIRGKQRIANTDTPASGDSIDCISPWDRTKWNSLSSFSWQTLQWDATGHFPAASTDIQVRFRQSDWQWIAGSSAPGPFWTGPGPYWDRVRLGRQVLTGPLIDEGIDARYQAQDAAPNDPSFPAGPLYAQAAGGDILGTTAFSRGADLGTNGSSPNLIVGDSITVIVQDVLGHAGLTVELHAQIVRGPHVWKSPPPYTVGPNKFFVIPADSARDATGQIVTDTYFVDMDDTYFRGGDELRYFWLATDAQGGVTSNPAGLTAVPANLQEAEGATGGLFEVTFLPSINWDAGYLARIAADAHGDLDPTPTEIAGSTQQNCILYYENINSRRRSGDSNRTSFMYTLDKFGYRDLYDLYDHSGLGNTNNHLGARMSPEQAKDYALIVYDAGNRGPGAPILPNGIDIDAEKIDMQAWFQTWNNLSGSPNQEHTLWILGSNAMQEKPLSPLYTVDMAAVFTAADQGQDANPDVFAMSNFTTHTACVMNHGVGATPKFALNGGCPTIRDYDDLAASGIGVVTHRYGKGAAGNPGAIVMHANAAGYSTILSSFPWFDIRSSVGQNPTTADEDLLSQVISCALPSACQFSPPDPNTGTQPGDNPQLAIPAQTALHQNTPNPFNPMTTIHFDLAHDAHVSLKIYDVAGRLVRRLSDETMSAGYNLQLTWNGLDASGNRVPSGVYFYRLVAGETTATRKLVVMK